MARWDPDTRWLASVEIVNEVHKLGLKPLLIGAVVARRSSGCRSLPSAEPHNVKRRYVDFCRGAGVCANASSRMHSS
jgi:hypothetical protein